MYNFIISNIDLTIGHASNVPRQCYKQQLHRTSSGPRSRVKSSLDDGRLNSLKVRGTSSWPREDSDRVRDMCRGSFYKHTNILTLFFIPSRQLYTQHVYTCYYKWKVQMERRLLKHIAY